MNEGDGNEREKVIHRIGRSGGGADAVGAEDDRDLVVERLRRASGGAEAVATDVPVVSDGVAKEKPHYEVIGAAKMAVKPEFHQQDDFDPEDRQVGMGDALKAKISKAVSKASQGLTSVFGKKDAPGADEFYNNSIVSSIYRELMHDPKIYEGIMGLHAAAEDDPRAADAIPFGLEKPNQVQLVRDGYKVLTTTGHLVAALEEESRVKDGRHVARLHGASVYLRTKDRNRAKKAILVTCTKDPKQSEFMRHMAKLELQLLEQEMKKGAPAPSTAQKRLEFTDFDNQVEDVEAPHTVWNYDIGQGHGRASQAKSPMRTPHVNQATLVLGDSQGPYGTRVHAGSYRSSAGPPRARSMSKGSYSRLHTPRREVSPLSNSSPEEIQPQTRSQRSKMSRSLSVRRQPMIDVESSSESEDEGCGDFRPPVFGPRNTKCATSEVYKMLSNRLTNAKLDCLPAKSERQKSDIRYICTFVASKATALRLREDEAFELLISAFSGRARDHLEDRRKATDSLTVVLDSLYQQAQAEQDEASIQAKIDALQRTTPSKNGLPEMLQELARLALVRESQEKPEVRTRAVNELVKRVFLSKVYTHFPVKHEGLKEKLKLRVKQEQRRVQRLGLSKDQVDESNICVTLAREITRNLSPKSLKTDSQQQHWSKRPVLAVEPDHDVDFLDEAELIKEIEQQLMDVELQDERQVCLLGDQHGSPAQNGSQRGPWNPGNGNQRLGFQGSRNGNGEKLVLCEKCNLMHRAKFPLKGHHVCMRYGQSPEYLRGKKPYNPMFTSPGKPPSAERCPVCSGRHMQDLGGVCLSKVKVSDLADIASGRKQLPVNAMQLSTSTESRLAALEAAVHPQ